MKNSRLKVEFSIIVGLLLLILQKDIQSSSSSNRTILS